MKPIYLHIAFYVTDTERKLNITGDSYLELKDDSSLKQIKDEVHSEVCKAFPEHDWNEPTFLAITQLSDELYARLFPKPKATDWEMSKEDGDQDLLDTIITVGISTRLCNVLQDLRRDVYDDIKVKTVRDLVRMKRTQFQKYRNVGKGTVAEVESIMKTFGWHWEMKVED